MAVNQWPKSPFGNDGDPYIREIVRRLEEVQANVPRVAQEAANGYGNSAANLKAIQRQLDDIQRSVDASAAVVSRLDALAVVVADDDALGAGGFTGFYNGAGRPQVALSTPTGRLDINFGGSLNSGSGYFVYSITDGATIYVDRATMQADPSRRVAVTGGASFAPSGYRTAIEEGLPTGVMLTVTLEYYATTDLTYILGGSLVARPAP